MIDEKRLLAEFVAARRDAADIGLSSKPSGDPAYELGRLIGYSQGLRQAEQILFALAKEEERDLL